VLSSARSSSAGVKAGEVTLEAEEDTTFVSVARSTAVACSWSERAKGEGA